MTYEHPSEDAARRRLESEFNDDEDYIVAGSLAPSIRHNLYSPTSTSSNRRPPDYTSYMTERNGGDYFRERSYGGMDEGRRNGGGYYRDSEPRSSYSSSRHISSSTYREPMDISPAGGAGRWDSGPSGGMGRYNGGGGDSYYTTERRTYGSTGLSPRDDRQDWISSSREMRDYREPGREERRGSSRDRYDNGYNRDEPPSSTWRSTSNGFGSSGPRGSRGSERSYEPEAPSYGRQPSRLLYDGAVEEREKERRFYEQTRANPKPPEEKEFMVKVQRELEHQRREWKDEIDKLTNSTLMPSTSTTYNVAKNSTIDTSGPQPIFKAFVDVSEFPPSSVKVNVDKLTNKVVVEAKQSQAGGGMAKSFTQRIQLPRFADDHNLVARMNKKGILKVEVPLIFYFPEQETRDDSSKAKSFVYEVRTDPVNGSKVMEILVNTGRDMSAKDLKVEMEGDKLLIWGERSSGSAGSTSPGGDESRRTLIKQYTMPPNADTHHIRIERTRDGRHAILIPLF